MRRRISTCLSGTLPGFTPLVYSVDRVAGRETKQAERRLASQIAWKWKREYSEMVGHMRTMMTLAVVRSNSILMCGSMVRRSYARPSVDEGAAVLGVLGSATLEEALLGSRRALMERECK
jgi:hypothetical protein